MRTIGGRGPLKAVVLVVLLSATPAGGAHGAGNVTALAVDPIDPTVLYAGTADRGVLKTTDAAATWSVTGLTGVPVVALAIDPQTPAILYAGTCDRGVLKSADGGDNWSPTGSLPDGCVHTIALDPVTPTTLYAFLPPVGVFKSTNAGTSWLASLTIEQVWSPWLSIDSLALDPLSPATLYVGSSSHTPVMTWGGVSTSSDGGASWVNVMDWWFWFDEAIRSLVVAPRADPLGPVTLYAGMAYSDYTAVWKSIDGGVSWTAGGLDPAIIGYQPVEHLVTDPSSPTTVYAVAGGGVFKSIDESATWTALNEGLPAVEVNFAVRRLVIDPQTTTTLYAATSVGVFKSTDGGAHWNPTGLIQQPF